MRKERILRHDSAIIILYDENKEIYFFAAIILIRNLPTGLAICLVN